MELINFDKMTEKITASVGNKAGEYHDSVHSAISVYTYQRRIKHMMEKEGLPLHDCIARLLPNEANPAEVAAKLTEGKTAFDQALDEDHDYNWREDLNGALSLKDMKARGEYLINLIYTFRVNYHGDIVITKDQAERYNALVDADEYNDDDIRFLTELVEGLINAHGDLLARTSVNIMLNNMDKMSDDMIRKVIEAYDLDAISRAAAMYVAQQTGDLYIPEGDAAVPPELLGHLAAAQTEVSKMLMLHWKAGVMVETLTHDIRHIISTVFHYIAAHMEDWIHNTLKVVTATAATIAWLLISAYMLGPGLGAFIFTALVMAGAWEAGDFDVAADFIIDFFKSAVRVIREGASMLRSLFTEDDAVVTDTETADRIEAEVVDVQTVETEAVEPAETATVDAAAAAESDGGEVDESVVIYPDSYGNNEWESNPAYT